MTSPIERLDDWRSGQHCPRKVGGTRKRRLWGRTLASVDTVLVHATAVRGGFGVDHAMVEAALVELDEAAPNAVEAAGSLGPARRWAVAKRYRETPYHGLYHPEMRMSVVQWPATDYTYHGDGVNSCSIGWAYDGLFKPEHQDTLDIEGGRESLRHFIEAALEQGCPLRRISAHACHSTKMHDPGPRVWLDVVLPVAEQFGLDPAPNWTTGVGQPWVKRWMEAAA